MPPLISVIMPVYNQKTSYLIDAIESILRQTFTDFEFLIIDDSSTKKDCIDTLEKYKTLDPRITVLRNDRNSGVAKSLNVGLAHSSAPIVARMDSDDISLPERLSRQYEYLQNNPDADLIGCQAHIIDEDGNVTGTYRTPSSAEEIRSSVLVTNPLIHPTWMFRKSLIDTEGGYSENSPATEDYEFILRIARRKDIRNLPDILLQYRFNPNGVSYKKNKFQELQSLKLRLKAFRSYGYPYWHAYKVILALLFFLLIPFSLKAGLLRFKQKYL